MGFINCILDVAGLLLWLNWRSASLDPVLRAAPATIAGTIRRTEPATFQRWHFLAALLALILIRAIFYWQIGPAVDWTPKIDLMFVVLAFRSNLLGTQLLFSALSFIQTWVVFYFWLLVLAMINRRQLEPDPLHKLVLLQLGPLGRWPRWIQALVPVILVGLLWIAVHPVLDRTGLLNPAKSAAHLFEQAALVGAALYFTLKYLLPAFLFIHLINSYVYLGNSPVWEFVNTTSRNLLGPLKRLPLQSRKIDFAPLVGIVLVLLLLHALPNWILGYSEGKSPQRPKLRDVVWPQ